MKRRTVLAASLALAAPRIVRAQGQTTLNFVPQADLANLDPIWSTSDVSRNHGHAVFDSLYGIDAQFTAKPQMVAGATTSADGKLWELTLRDGLMFHDGTPCWRATRWPACSAGASGTRSGKCCSRRSTSCRHRRTKSSGSG